jgi:hypothetical protein
MKKLAVILILLPVVAMAAISGGQALRNVARAWLLDPPSTETITPSQSGMGWADGKFTLQTPAGAMQLYMSGDPLEGTLYWPGRITVDSIEAATLTASISGSQVDNGSIGSAVMVNSMTQPMSAWQDSAGFAGANGLTYANTGPLGQSQPTTPGNYFATIDVISGGGTVRNYLQGTVRTHAQMGVPNLVSAPATASSTGTAGQVAYDASYFYVCTGTNTWKRVAISTW